MMNWKFFGTIAAVLLGGCSEDVSGEAGESLPFWPSTSTAAQPIEGVTRMRVSVDDVLVRSGPQSFALGRLYRGEAFDVSYRDSNGWMWGYAWGHVNGCAWVQLAVGSNAPNFDAAPAPPAGHARSCGTHRQFAAGDFSAGDADVNAIDGQTLNVTCASFETWGNWNHSGPQHRSHGSRSDQSVRLRYTVRGGGGAMVRLGPGEWLFMRRECLGTSGVSGTMPRPPACEHRVGLFAWNCAGPIAGLNCVRLHEDSDPHTWDDNYVCTAGDIGLRWSNAGPVAGMRCTQLREDADPHTWNDNYLCVPESSTIELFWSMAGPIAGRACLRLYEPSDPHTWGDNYLCFGTWAPPPPSPPPPPPPSPCGGHTQRCCDGGRCDNGDLICHGGQCINHRCCARCSGLDRAHHVMVSSDCTEHARNWCADRSNRGRLIGADWGYCEP